jgi:xanthine/CO dehydrogenase XdhC/CoxF family maturation factor
MHEQKSKHQVYMRAGGAVEVFFEYVAPPHRLVIFGAGLDAQPLVTLAKQQGWHVTVVDSRAHFARSHLFPQADAVICHAINQHERLAVDLQGAAVAVMTHSLTQDQYWLRYALAESPRYIGQLGPRHRTEKLLAAIESQMADPQGYAAGRAVLHYPIGLDLGGDSMEATALSILAEMTAVMNQRSAQMLSQKETSIHVS